MIDHHPFFGAANRLVSRGHARGRAIAIEHKSAIENARLRARRVSTWSARATNWLDCGTPSRENVSHGFYPSFRARFLSARGRANRVTIGANVRRKVESLVTLNRCANRVERRK